MTDEVVRPVEREQWPVTPRHLDDARSYYRTFVNPYENFNRIEITFSHLFRDPNPLIGGRTYGAALYNFFVKHNLIGNGIVEIGGGLGDVMYRILQADAGRLITRCRMIDISPRLRESQRERLSKLDKVEISFSDGDCESIASSLNASDKLLLCNGVIADLTADWIDSTSDICDVVRGDAKIHDFVRRYSGVQPFWLPTGTLRFISELARCLAPDAVALLTEYESTPDNQPTWFDNHYECGIDFDLLQSFAAHVGLKSNFFNIADILGFDSRTPLLTIDMFTSRHAMTFRVPRVAELARLSTPLSVAAYSKSTLQEALKAHLEPHQLSRLMADLSDCFFPLTERGFDTKNPTTWNYKGLLLRRSI